MKKRTFIKASSTLLIASALAPVLSCKETLKSETQMSAASDTFTLPDLTYGFDALAPNIDAMTMEIHHDKHHAGYVRKLNDALTDSSFKGRSLDEMLSSLNQENEAIRNNGGGHYNHSLFWTIMSPGGGGEPSGKLLDAISGAFGSYSKFKEIFSAAAASRFGSGWAWLTQGTDGKLFVSSTPNQDNPLMSNLVSKNGTPLLGIDVWEHAYYLNYQNRRGDYINNFFNVIDWDTVSSRLS